MASEDRTSEPHNTLETEPSLVLDRPVPPAQLPHSSAPGHLLARHTQLELFRAESDETHRLAAHGLAWCDAPGFQLRQPQAEHIRSLGSLRIIAQHGPARAG